MALPKIDVPLYELNLPSTEEKISYRPFLVKEEKILLMAMEGKDEKEITKAVKQIINNCVVTKGIDSEKLPLFDIEYILLNLRSKSMGDIIKTSYVHQDCPQAKEEGKEPKAIEVEIDVSLIKVTKDPKHTNKIQLTKDVGVIMKYPDVSMMDKMQNIDTTNPDSAIDIITKCIESLYDEETVYGKTDYTPKELKEFILNLTQEQFSKIEQFFATIPKLQTEIEFVCDCGYKEKILLEGLSSFFG
jgi:hypothetical protein